MLVLLLTAALRPPLLGVGRRSRQLGGGSRGSGGGSAEVFALRTVMQETLSSHGGPKQKKKCFQTEVVWMDVFFWYRSLLVSSGRLSLTSPWHSSKMSRALIPSLASRPRTTRRSTAATRLHDFKLEEFSRI